MVCFGQATLTKGRFRAQALVHSSASSDIRSSDHRDLESIRAAAGIQPMTLGSIVSTPKNERGVIPLAFSRFGACKRLFMVTSNATCRVRPSGIVPSDHSPSIERLESPIQKNAAFRSDTSRASLRPKASR